MISLAGAEAAAAGSIRENMRLDVEPMVVGRGRQQVQHIPAHGIHTILSSSRYSIFYSATQASLHTFDNTNDILQIKTITN